MWVDIANLVGPQGNPGKDGDKGDPGPVNIGLDPNSPIGWDQTGGFTFNFVDGSEQTVNLPIASAQSAGLLGANGQLPTTGTRDITSLLNNIVSGKAYIDRTGPMVTLSLDTITFADTGWVTLVTLPAGFRPRITQRENLIDATHGHQIGVYSNGTVSNNRDQSYTLRQSFCYSTGDPWPSMLPGVATQTADPGRIVGQASLVEKVSTREHLVDAVSPPPQTEPDA